MQQSARQVGALAPRRQSQAMPASSVQWRLGKQLCKHLISRPLKHHAQLRHLSQAVPAQPSQLAFCSATEHHISQSSLPGPSQPVCRATAHQQARGMALRAAAAGRTPSGGMLAASHRALTSSSFPGLEPAAFSGQHGLRRSVRLKALSEKGHCGEEGLVKGAGVVCTLSSPIYLPRPLPCSVRPPSPGIAPSNADVSLSKPCIRALLEAYGQLL